MIFNRSFAQWLFCSIFVAMLYFGVRDIMHNIEKNRCSMTYMYEAIDYVPVPLPSSIRAKFPRYSLYVYGEGDEELTGIPVLFVPGNAGSYKQVRSLASISFRKSYTRMEHFNYFAVDLNEEFSGLYGGVLLDQAEYVNHCIIHILSKYKKQDNPPLSVLLIGHSIGGVIARGLFALPNFDPSTVTTIITASSPHRRPVIAIDRHMASFYDSVNSVIESIKRMISYWREHNLHAINSKGQAMNNLITVSVGGGHRDSLVRSDLTSLVDIASANCSINIITTAVPRTWLTTDHLCIVWCKEFVLAVVRSVFDMVDVNEQISLSPVKRKDILEHHLVRHSGVSKYPNPFKNGNELKILYEGYLFRIAVPRIWKIPFGKQKSKKLVIVFPLKPQRIVKDRFVAVTSSSSDSWIISCNGTNYYECETAVDISDKAQLIPHKSGNLKYIDVNLKTDLPRTTHILLPPANGGFFVSEFFRSTSKICDLKLPSIVGFTAFDTDDQGHYFMACNLTDMQQIWQAYYVQINSSKECLRYTTIRFHVPWFKEDVFWYNRSGEDKFNFTIFLQTPYPVRKNFSDSPKLTLWTTNAKCRYRIIMTMDYSRALGQMVRYYGLFIPGWIMVLVLMLILNLVNKIEESCTTLPSNTLNKDKESTNGEGDSTEPVDPPTQSIDRLLLRQLLSNELDRRWKVASTLATFSYLISFYIPRVSWSFPYFPEPDIFTVMKSGEWSLYLLPTVHLAGISLLYYQVLIVEWFFYSIAWILRYLSRHISLIRLIGRIITTIYINLYVNVVVGIVITLICLTLCGALGLYLALLFSYVKLLAVFNHKPKRGSAYRMDDRQSFHVCFLLYNATVIFSMITVPSIVTWFKNLKYGYKLISDPYVFESIIISCGLLTLLQKSVHNTNIVFKFPQRWIIQALTVMAVTYALYSIYRLLIMQSILVVSVLVLAEFQDRKKEAKKE